jgi:hypothetical protein
MPMSDSDDFDIDEKFPWENMIIKDMDKEMICPLCKKSMVKHIIKEGARYHVHSYDTNGIHCSEKDCEDNHGYGKCVPKEKDPDYGLSIKERIKKIFEE